MAIDTRAAISFNHKQHYSTAEIKAIQELVGAEADGVFGRNTIAAIAAWQTAEGLAADGRVGPSTLAEMEAEHLANEREGSQVEDTFDEVEPTITRSPTVLADAIDLRKAKRTKRRGLPKRRRAWTRVDAIVLHQTSTTFGKPTHRLVPNVPAHSMTFASGAIALLNDPTAYMAHAHGFNRQSIGIEIDARAAGVEGVFSARAGAPGPNTFYRPKSRPDWQPVEVSDEQIESTRRLILYYVEQVAANGSEIKFIFAHRQSTNTRTSDPGSRIWQEIGIWAQHAFGLSDGGPSYTIGKGQPIPTAWDPRVFEVPYSARYAGY